MSKIDMILFLTSQLLSFSTSAFVITRRFAQENPKPCFHELILANQIRVHFETLVLLIETKHNAMMGLG